MNNKFSLLLLLPLLFIFGCGDKFDYRYKYSGNFTFTYHYVFHWSGGVSEYDKVEQTAISIDEEDEKIHFTVGYEYFTLFVNKEGELHLPNEFGNRGEQVGSYNGANDKITFPDQKLNWGNSNATYMISATRVE